MKTLLLFPCIFLLISHSANAAPEPSDLTFEIDSLEEEEKSYTERLFSPTAPGFNAAPDQPSGWMALPPGRPFPSLLPDPRDLKLALRKNSKNELEADVGGYRSFAGWKGMVGEKESIIHIGLEGAAYFLLRQEGPKFPLHSSDGVIGVYGEAVRGNWLYQLRFTHLSAHLSDGLFGIRQRFTYTRETLSLRLARQWGSVRAYIGYHFLVHTKPELPRHSAQVGGYSILPGGWKKLHPYLGADLKIKNAEEGTTYSVIGGLALVSSLGAPPLRFGATYTKGHDLRGQFFRERSEKWSFGIDMDI